MIIKYEYTINTDIKMKIKYSMMRMKINIINENEN